MNTCMRKVVVKPDDELKSYKVVANCLQEGHIVYLSDSGQWSRDVARAAIYSGLAAHEALDSALSGVDVEMVIGPECIELDQDYRPVRLRDRIRFNGPTQGPFSIFLSHH